MNLTSETTVRAQNNYRDFYKVSNRTRKETFPSESMQEKVILEKNAAATVLIVRDEDLIDVKDGYLLKALPLRDRSLKNRRAISCKSGHFNHHQCILSDFGLQPSASCLGTGVLINGNSVLTAAHILLQEGRVSVSQIKKLRIITNYRLQGEEDFSLASSGRLPIDFMQSIKIPYGNVYGIDPDKDFFRNKFRFTWDGIDAAVLPLKGENAERLVSVQLSEKKTFLPNQQGPQDEIYALGYGLGLPLKYSNGFLKVQKNGMPEADLKTFAGNSGSPVFDRYTHKLIGILSRGKLKGACTLCDETNEIIQPLTDVVVDLL